ncbi:MAG: Holliday junction branch migration protein RuvA [Thermoanaerobaculia bacterium]
MIGWLRGTPRRLTPEGLLLEVGGVGYQLHVPLSTFYELQKRGAERPIELFVHTHVREDALELYGFWTERERTLFEKLIAVSGIGPRLARVILSGMAPDDLLAAIAGGDVARLSTIPGIGKKTADRMVLELRDKVQDLAAELPEEARPAATEDHDLVLALVNLGYRERQAEEAVAASRRDLPEAEFHEVLRASLKRLSRA